MGINFPQAPCADVCSTRGNPFQRNGFAGLSSTAMIAFDTNLLVSLAVNDDPNQAEIAEHLLDTQQVFVPRAVLLGTE